MLNPGKDETLTVHADRYDAVHHLNSAVPPDSSIAKLVTSALECLEDAKAEDVVAIDLTGRTPIADYMIIASGRSDRHVGAIADQLLEALKKAGCREMRVQGLPQCDWVLIDTGDIIVHVFRPEVREFYNLEKLWSDNAPIERRIV